MWIALAAVLALAAALRLWGLGVRPLWLDEASSLWFASRDWGYLWSEVPRFETHPPLYYMLLKGWIAVAGTGEAALRLPSVLAGLGTVLLAFATGRAAGGPDRGMALGLLAALLAAVSYLQIVHAQDARPYTLATLGTALMLAGAVGLIAGRRGPWPVLALASGMALAMWSHLLGAVPAALTAAVLAAWWARGGFGRRAFWSLAIAAVLVLALVWPHLLNVAGQLQRDFSGFWIARPGVAEIARITVQAVGQPTIRVDLRVELAVALALPALGLIGLWRALAPTGAARPWLVALPALLLAGHWAAVVALSLLVQPVLLPRTLIFLQPALVLVLAGLPWLLENRALRAVLLAGLLAYALPGPFRLGGVLEFPRPWPEIVQAIAASDRPGAPVLLVPALLSLPMAHYGDRQGVAPDLRPLPVAFDDPAQGLPDFNGRAVTAADLPGILAGLAGAPTVWLVTRRADLYDPQGLVPAALAAAGYRQSVVIDSDGSGRWIMLLRFDRAG